MTATKNRSDLPSGFFGIFSRTVIESRIIQKSNLPYDCGCWPADQTAGQVSPLLKKQGGCPAAQLPEHYIAESHTLAWRARHSPEVQQRSDEATRKVVNSSAKSEWSPKIERFCAPQQFNWNFLMETLCDSRAKFLGQVRSNLIFVLQPIGWKRPCKFLQMCLFRSTVPELRM